VDPPPQNHPPSRARLLEAGRSLFHELRLPHLWAGISVSEVARHAGVTRATFYANWPTQEDYVAALVRYVEDPARVEVSPQIAQALTDLAAQDVELVEALRRLLRANLEGFTADPDLRFEMSLIAKADDAVVGDAIRRAYGEIDELLTASYSLVLDRWQREPRPPLTLTDVAVIADALLVGLVQRRWVDPDRAPTRLYEDAVLALLPQLTRPIGDTRTLEDLHDDIERFVAVPGEAPTATSVDDAHVLAVARRLLAERTWTEISLGDVAATSGTAEAALYERYGSKAGLATVMLAHQSVEALSRTEGLPDEPTARLGTLVQWLAEIIDANPELALNTLAVLTRMAPPPDLDALPPTPMRSVIAAVIRNGQAAGTLRTDHDADALADVVIRTLLVERTTTPGGEILATTWLVDSLHAPPPTQP
jgi:AcrR family transcriptional regulator